MRRRVLITLGTMFFGAFIFTVGLALAADVGALNTSGTTVPAQPISGMDSSGVRRVPRMDASNRFVVATVTGSGVQDVGGDIAHDGVDTGNPVKIGYRANSGDQAVVSANNDRVDAAANLLGEIKVAYPVCAGTAIQVTCAVGTSSSIVTNGVLYRLSMRGVGAQMAWAGTAALNAGFWLPEGGVELQRSSGTSAACITVAGSGTLTLTPCTY